MDIRKQIEQKVKSVYRDYLRFEIEREKLILNLFDDISKELEVAVIRAADKEGKIPAAKMADFRGKGKTGGIVRNILIPYNNKLLSLMQFSIKKSMDFGIQANEESLKPFIKGRLSPILTTRQKQKIRDRVAKDLMLYEVMRTETSPVPTIFLLEQEQLELPLSTRVWNLSYQDEVAIMQLLQAGIIQEKDVYEINRNLRKYLVMKEELYGKWKAAYRPPRGVYKSAYKNAVRLQRTEMAKSYRQSNIEYCRRMESDLKGMQWMLGSGDNCSICIDYATTDAFGLGAGVFPINQFPAIPHPHCNCWQAPVIKDELLAKAA